MYKKSIRKDNNKMINTIIIIGIIFLIASLVLMLSRNKKIENHIIDISYEEYQDIIKKDEDSIILLTTPSCVYCKEYKPYVNYVCDDYNLVVYNLDISTLSYEQYLEIHDKYHITKDNYNKDGVPSILTPTTLIVRNNEEVDSTSSNIGYSGFLELLKKNEIIK